MASGVAEQFEEKLLTPEGYRDYVDTKAPWRDAQGKVIGIVGVSRDVTLRNQAEAALRQSEQRLKHAQQIANVGTWEWDIQTGALVWSEQVYRQMGEEPGAVNPTYDAFVRHIHAEDRAGFDAALQRALAGTAPFDLEVRMLAYRRDGARTAHARRVAPRARRTPARHAGRVPGYHRTQTGRSGVARQGSRTARDYGNHARNADPLQPRLALPLCESRLCRLARLHARTACRQTHPRNHGRAAASRRSVRAWSRFCRVSRPNTKTRCILP